MILRTLWRVDIVTRDGKRYVQVTTNAARLYLTRDEAAQLADILSRAANAITSGDSPV